MKLQEDKDFTKNTTCRYCNSLRLTKFLSLGIQPPSNSFIRPDQVHAEKRYPLDVYICENCYLAQLIDVVSPKIIFDDYLYLSSSSKALKKHYENLANNLTKRFRLKASDVVVDIGCNDGILLHSYSSTLKRVGVEPSKVAAIAKDSGLDIFKDFFQPSTAKRIVREFGPAKLATATNVFAHIDNISNFVAGLPILLDDDGVFIIEAPYLIDTIDQVIFDTIYHEHLCYLSLTPIVPFLKRFGLEVFDVTRIPFGASGPAFRIFIAKKGSRVIQKSVVDMLAYEMTWGTKNLKKYLGYAKKIDRIKKDVTKIIKGIHGLGATLGGYGAPAKGNTLLNYFAITPQQLVCIAETNPLKQGLLTPGSHIPIVSEEEFLQRMPEYALLLSWNYLDFFLEKSEYIRRGGKFLVPIPLPRIAP